jgi:bifunctional N-acetylglucosamine-1-phosphate-uridyltransferase/glucosamine-1-phosphate-acetyltransferase GlmU-like protein
VSFTLLVPAAGSGRRLSAPVPKPLVELEGRPLCAWILDRGLLVCDEAILVIPPGTERAFVDALAEFGPRIRYAVQTAPRGMADAIRAGLSSVRTSEVMVVWADQIGLSERTVARLAETHQKRRAAATVPTVVKPRAYIAIERDPEGRIRAVREARETGAEFEDAESDCGLFAFSTAALVEVLRRAASEGLGIGRTTGEANLLPLLPLFEALPGGIAGLVVSDPEESRGVNTPEELEAARRLVASRAQHSSPSSVR